MCTYKYFSVPSQIGVNVLRPMSASAKQQGLLRDVIDMLIPAVLKDGAS